MLSLMILFGVRHHRLISRIDEKKGRADADRASPFARAKVAAAGHCAGGRAWRAAACCAASLCGQAFTRTPRLVRCRPHVARHNMLGAGVCPLRAGPRLVALLGALAPFPMNTIARGRYHRHLCTSCPLRAGGARRWGAPPCARDCAPAIGRLPPPSGASPRVCPPYAHNTVRRCARPAGGASPCARPVTLAFPPAPARVAPFRARLTVGACDPRTCPGRTRSSTPQNAF